jgi:hypothetical protein
MALDFPSSPINGQTFNNYTYDSTAGAWRSSALYSMGLPIGGTANQFLTKIDSSNYNTQWSTTLGVANGGTGATTLASGAYLKGAGTSAVTAQSGIPGEDITSGTVAIARGGTGVTTGAGIVPIVPTFMNYGSGTGSISSNGLVTFTNASYLASNAWFTSAYNRYRVMLDIQSCSVNDYVYWRGVDAAGNSVTTNAYNTGTVYQQSGSVAAYDNGNTVQTYSRIGYVTNDDGASYILDIFNPFQTRKTKGHFVSQYSASGLTNLTGAFILNATTSLSGMLIAPVAGANGNWTGTIRIFGVL